MDNTQKAIDPELEKRLALVREDEDRKKRFREQVNRERRFLIPILIFVLLLLPNFGRAKVLGKSMEPQYYEGDALVILKTYRTFSPLKEGDIVVVKKKQGEYLGEDLVKRVAFIQNSAGNAPLPQFVQTARGKVSFRELFPRLALGFDRVPANQIVVVGDNFWVSADSRDPEIGYITDDEVVGKVLNQ
ncbi:MAG: hypothetical protein OHK0029_25930 [Armatimonadaceae bacterium]